MPKTEGKVSSFNVGILGNMDATEIAIGIKNGNFTEKEVLQCVQDRMNLVNPDINAVMSSNFSPDLNDKDRNKNGVFSGVPTFIKDLLNVKGFPTSQGSRAMPKTRVNKSDAVVKQIQSTGCIIVGKSTTSEFGLLPATETLVNGDTRNPHNISYSTGGSSGGAGALVASGVVPIAHAADGGGSIRIPAACCGLIGLKPTRGRHNQSPTKNLPIDIVCQGIVSRSVRDTANYFAAIEQYYSNKNLPPIGKVEHAGKKRLRIALFTESPAGIASAPEVIKVIEEAGKICENLGHTVTVIPNPFNAQFLFDFLIYYSFLANMASNFGKITYDRKFDAKQLEPFTKELGGYFSKLMFLFPGSVKRLKGDLVKNYNTIFDQQDIVLNPVLSSTVPKLGYFGHEVSFISHVLKLNNYVNFTTIQNTTGAPAISLPMGKCPNGLPIGAMFGAKIGEDRKLLELAFELEEAKVFTAF